MNILNKNNTLTRIGLATLLSLVGLGGFSSFALAHDAPNKSFAQMTEEAELIFQGVISKVEYGAAKGGEEEDGVLPQTFVTYKIEDIQKGKAAEGNSITLQFIGGPTNDGKVLVVSNSPIFDVGERDLLFVRGNGQSDVPLVGGDKGRFRVVQEKMFSNDGHEVLLDSKGKIKFGRQHALKEVMNNRIGKFQFNFERAKEAPEGKEVGKRQYKQNQRLKIRGEHLNKRKFKAQVAKLKARIKPEKLRSLKPVKSFKKGRGMKPRAIHPAGPLSRLPREGKRAPQQTEFDKAELQALKNNKGNPAFRGGPPRGLKPQFKIPPQMQQPMQKTPQLQRPGMPGMPNLQKGMKIRPRGIEGEENVEQPTMEE